MKAKTILAAIFLCSAALNAQEKIKEVVTDQYDRNSVSYIMVDRGGSYSSIISDFQNTMVISDKFDQNLINTRQITIEADRPNVIAQESIDEAVNEMNLGKEIISYIYNRKDDGSFNDKILLERGRYNATDQDMINASAAKVTELSLEWGETLVNTSYIIIVDFYDFKSSTTDYGTTYNAYANAYAYKLDAGREVLDNFYMSAWADPESPAADKANARKAYDKMKFQMIPVATVQVLGSSSGEEPSYKAACNNAYSNIVYELENTIPAWQTAVSVLSTRPISAKIGMKEGVTNGSRFQAYSYKEDRDGNLKSVKHGMVRATVISDNRGNNTGNATPSLFYQISGVQNIKEGYILKQDNDLKLGAAFVLGYGPLGFRVGVDMDYISNIGQNGAIVYPMVNIGANFIEGITLVDAMVGVGYGVPVSRFFEVTPYATYGGYLTTDGDWLTSAAEPGVRLALTYQPLAFIVSAGYQLLIGNLTGGDINIKAGVKWTF